ncbi:hypothetical protein A2U01_0084690, partial [Trifolium medium]|nr:hypothetical protein [Trifolium medium]
MWEALRNDISADLNKIHNGDMNELAAFQKSTRAWVEDVNREFESVQLRKKGRLLTNDFFEETTVTNSI